MEDNELFIIALPSGKSLEEPTLGVLKAAHVDVQRAHPRLCTAQISGLCGITSAVFIKPNQIPSMVSDGQFPIGITGMDAVRENGGHVKVLTELSYSRATSGGTRCVIFCREDNPAKSIRDIEGKIIVSEYPKETGEFLIKHGVSALLRDCTGSAESLVAIGQYEYGVCLVETGTSLRINSLTEVATVFVSQTVLIVNEDIYEKDPVFRNYADFLGRIMNGVLNARGNVYLAMNVPKDRVEDVCKILPALQTPTVEPQRDPAFCSVATVVPANEINTLKMELEMLGARGFVELVPSSVQ